jgi:hypothetical protein
MSSDPFDPDADWDDDRSDFDAPSDTATPDENRVVIDAIRILEDTLQEIEDPVGILVTLFDMYTEIEGLNDAGNCLVEAARRVTEGEHPELCFFLYNNLELFAQLNPEAQSAYEALADMISNSEEDLGANTLHLDQRKIYQHDLIPELYLAQHLMRARKISDAEYKVILHDLCWYSTHAPLSPRTLAYVLDDRVLPHRDAALEFLAHDSGVPFIDLGLIEPDPQALELLPPEFMRVRAACAYGFVAGEPLIAVLNPFNLQLRDDVSMQVDLPCHYTFTSAQGYQRILDLVSG